MHENDWNVFLYRERQMTNECNLTRCVEGRKRWQKRGILRDYTAGETRDWHEFVCPGCIFFGGLFFGGVSKETVIIFDFTQNKWALSTWLMTGSLLRWNQENVSVHRCQSFCDQVQRWRVSGSGSDFMLHWRSLIPRSLCYFGNG